MDTQDGRPLDPSRLVVSPIAGQSYRVFVRTWNLELLPAIGVHVKAWAINPGLFGVGNQNDPYYQQHLIGGRWLELGGSDMSGESPSGGEAVRLVTTRLIVQLSLSRKVRH